MADAVGMAGPFRRQRWPIALLLAAFVVWGAVVELRAAFLQRRMTDAGCFFRAGWVVRTGGPLYSFTEENGWHYLYPPLFAILMTPLADAPAGVERAGQLPYPVSIGLWYGFSVLCLAAALHLLASALERRLASPSPAGSRRWWALRLIPLLVCLPPVGHTLMRGQTNLLLLLLLGAALASALDGRSWRAGLWLAGAICLKVYPAFLLLFFLWRRDRRALAGCAAGLVVGLALVPAAVFGPARTVDYYRQYARVLLGPALGLGTDRSLGDEILDSVNNDSQSLEAAVHNTLHPGRDTRPAQPSDLVRWLARGLGVLLTLLTLAAARNRADSGPGTVLLFGALVVLMLVLCPVCHTHYLCLLMPLVMGLLAAGWQRHGGLRPNPRLAGLLALAPAVYVLASLPSLEVLRDLAVTLYPTLLLWLAAVATLRELPPATGWRPARVPGSVQHVTVTVTVPDALGYEDRVSSGQPVGLP